MRFATQLKQPQALFTSSSTLEDLTAQPRKKTTLAPTGTVANPPTITSGPRALLSTWLCYRDNVCEARIGNLWRRTHQANQGIPQVNPTVAYNGTTTLEYDCDLADPAKIPEASPQGSPSYAIATPGRAAQEAFAQSVPSGIIGFSSAGSRVHMVSWASRVILLNSNMAHR